MSICETFSPFAFCVDKKWWKKRKQIQLAEIWTLARACGISQLVQGASTRERGRECERDGEWESANARLNGRTLREFQREPGIHIEGKPPEQLRLQHPLQVVSGPKRFPRIYRNEKQPEIMKIHKPIKNKEKQTKNSLHIYEYIHSPFSPRFGFGKIFQFSRPYQRQKISTHTRTQRVRASLSRGLVVPVLGMGSGHPPACAIFTHFVSENSFARSALSYNKFLVQDKILIFMWKTTCNLLCRSQCVYVYESVSVCMRVRHVDLLKVPLCTSSGAHLEIASHKFIAYSPKPKSI